MSTKKAPRTESLPNRHGDTFKVGDGCHWGYNGDSYPGTVVKVSASGRKVWVSKDKYRVLRQGELVEVPMPAFRGTFEGTDGSHPVHFTTVTVSDDQLTEYTLRKSGYFHAKGYSTGSAWALNPGRHYSYNPHF